jgi:signal transduction histidine kinase
MKHLVVLFWSLVGCALAYSQAPPNDYLARAAAAKTDSQKVVVFTAALDHYADRNLDSVSYFKAQALSQFAGRGQEKARGTILHHMALVDRSHGRVKSALNDLEAALALYRTAGYQRGIADVLGDIGSMEAGKGNIDVAARYIVSALKLQDSLGNKDGAMVSYMNLASLYLQQNDTARASHFVDEALKCAAAIPVNDHVIGLYNLQGVIYAMEGRNAEALSTFMHSLELSDGPKFVTGRVECLSYLGQYYLDAGQPDKAIRFLDQGLQLATRYNRPELRSNMLLTLAAILQTKDIPATTRYLEEALQIADSTHNKAFMVTVYEAQAAFFKDIGKYKEALLATERKQKIADSLFAISKSVELSTVSATHELEKSDEQVQMLERESRRNARQRNLFIAISFGVAALLAVLYFYFRRTVALNRKLKEHQEELKELNIMKDKLFSIIGHDLRGPISSIPTVIDIYEDPRTDEDEKKYLLNSLREHARASSEMLDKLLFWGQSLVKGLRLQQADVDVKDTIRQSIALKKLVLDEKGIKITCNVPKGLMIKVDATHFDFIIRNLLSNAIKYSHLGGSIIFNADTTTRTGYTIVTIADNGTGIPEAMLPRVFNPMRSMPGTADEKGTGIGLMLCKEFTLLNGGNIWVESEFGKGTTFFIALPSA